MEEAADQNAANTTRAVSRKGRQGRAASKDAQGQGAAVEQAAATQAVEAAAHGQEAADLEPGTGNRGKKRRSGKDGAGKDKVPPRPPPTQELLDLLAVLTPTFPPNIQKKANSFQKDVAALIAVDAD